jgi:glycosyltransferase involved in cell wall biosynthesis
MNMPFFSIIIPTYNRAHSIRKAIESVLKQTFQNFEIIIIDDASTDNTKETIEEIVDQRIIYYRNEINQERCISRNKGIELAQGEYICFLDSDDYHLPNHLQTIYDEIEKNNFNKAFYFVNAWNETEEGERSERTCPDFPQTHPQSQPQSKPHPQPQSQSHLHPHPQSFYTYFLRYTVNPQRWAVHHSIFEKVKFDPDVVICEDMDTSLRIVAKQYAIVQIKERTTVYVAASDSFTYGDKNKWEKELFYLKRIFNKNELKGLLQKKEMNRLLSMCYFNLSQKTFKEKLKIKTLIYSLKSFFLCPKGYNGKTNKILLYQLYKTVR